MIGEDVKAQFKNLDDRLARVEQFLPTVATKDDLKPFATKDDLKPFATKDDLKPFATKDDLRPFPTTDDLNRQRRELEAVIATLATKDDLKAERRELNAVIATLATKEDLRAQRRELDAVIATLATKEEMKALFVLHTEQIRTHFDVVAESLRDEIRMTQDGHIATTSRVETLEHGHDRLDRRVTALEARASAKRRK